MRQKWHDYSSSIIKPVGLREQIENVTLILRFLSVSAVQY